MTRPLPATARAIIAASDAGQQPNAIAEAVGVTLRYVHAVLAEHRPDRARKPRTKTSALRLRILLGKAEGKKAGAIAAELAGSCSRAYVYAVLNEGAAIGK